MATSDALQLPAAEIRCADAWLAGTPAMLEGHAARISLHRNDAGAPYTHMINRHPIQGSSQRAAPSERAKWRTERGADLCQPRSRPGAVLVALACAACTHSRVPDANEGELDAIVSPDGGAANARDTGDPGSTTTSDASAHLDPPMQPSAQPPAAGIPAAADPGVPSAGAGSLHPPPPAATANQAGGPAAPSMTSPPSGAGGPAMSGAAGAAGAPVIPSAPGSEATCRAQLNACWLSGDAAGCIRKAHDCGLFPQGVDTGIACYTSWTLCIVQLAFDFAECGRRAVPCGLVPESALECADRMDVCISRGPLSNIPNCWQEGTTCGGRNATTARARRRAVDPAGEKRDDGAIRCS